MCQKSFSWYFYVMIKEQANSLKHLSLFSKATYAHPLIHTLVKVV